MLFGKRNPVDAEGHVGAVPPQSTNEPELQLEGKVILVGTLVKKTDVLRTNRSSSKRTKMSVEAPVEQRDDVPTDDDMINLASTVSKDVIDLTAVVEVDVPVQSESKAKKTGSSWGWSLFGGSKKNESDSVALNDEKAKRQTGQIIATKTPVVTTEPKVVTTEPKVVTTEPKVVTTEPKVVTTEPKVVTTEPKVVTTEPKRTSVLKPASTPKRLDPEEQQLKQAETQSVSSEEPGPISKSPLPDPIAEPALAATLPDANAPAQHGPSSTPAVVSDTPPKPAVVPAAQKHVDESFSWAKVFGWGGEKKPEARDDDSMEGSTKLLGDLQSLPPSVQGEVTIGGKSLQSTDFDAKRGDSSFACESVVAKKLKEIVIPRDRDSKMSELTEAKKQTDQSFTTRRQILIKELRTAIATYGRYDVRCANIGSALGDLLEEAGEHEQAIKLHKDAVTIYSVKLGDDHAMTTNAKVHLATVMEKAGEYDEAVSMYYAIASMTRALKGEKDTSVADTLALMALTLKKNGEYQQAIKELKRALKIYREALGDTHGKVSSTVDAITSLYITVGDFEKAAAILEEVVKLKAATMGMKSKEVAETLSSLAMTYECSEQFSAAMKSLKKAYRIYTELEGYSSEDATIVLNKIAKLYDLTGDHNRASIAYLGVLRGRKIQYGEDDLQVGETYFRLGESLRRTGQLEKSLKCMKEALPIYVAKGVEIEDVEKIAEIMHEMALIYQGKQQHSEAIRIFRQELSVRRKIGQHELPHIAKALNNLGYAEYEAKNNSRALKYLVEALTIHQEKGHHGVDCAEVLFNTGLVFAAVRNKDRAFEAFSEADRLFAELGYHITHPSRANTLYEIKKLH